MQINVQFYNYTWLNKNKEVKPVNPKGKQTLNTRWKDWCWSWSSSTLTTWCKELTHWKRPWCWKRLRAGGEGGDRGWDGWMASLTRWTWVWANSGRQWLVSAVYGVTKNWARLSNWTELNGRKRRVTKEPLDKAERGEWKSWLKPQRWKH